MRKTKLVAIVSVVCLLIFAAAAAGAYFFSRDAPLNGEKSITIEVYHKDGTEKTFPIRTSAQYLRPALDEAGLIGGRESATGLFVTTVDGYTADEAAKEWWGLTKSGEYVDTSVDSAAIADGDVYEFTLNVGW